MRLALRGDTLLERLALRIGLVPTPAAEAWGAIAVAGVLTAATACGLTGRLTAGPCTAEVATRELGLDPTATRLLLDCLEAGRYVTCRAGVYAVTRSARRWLDPDSPYSVAGFVAGTADYWAWWSGLPEILRTGTPQTHHGAPPEDPYWDRYVHGQFELARLSATEIGRRLRVPATATSILDVGGGHGWYSAVLCRRYPRLRATVLDLPGSVRVGRQIIAEAGLSDRITFRNGDALTADLGTGYDVVLCFNLVHHLSPPQVVDLFARIRGALAPEGTIAVLDAFAPSSRRLPPAAAVLGMFMYLSSGARCYTVTELHDWLAQTGFSVPRRVPVRRIPGLALFQADGR